MFTFRHTITGAVAVAALSLAALTGATPAAHAAAGRAPGYHASTIAAPPAPLAVRSLSGAVTQAAQKWNFFAYFAPWDWGSCNATGAAGWAIGFWSSYQCRWDNYGWELWVLQDQAE